MVEYKKPGGRKGRNYTRTEESAVDYPNRKPVRLTEYDYASPGAYFVTVCTHDRRCILSRIDVGAAISRPQDTPIAVILTPYGEIVDQAIRNIPSIYPHISVDKYVIMPNHVHLILCIHGDDAGRLIAAPTVSRVIGHMKRWASKQTGIALWQKSFHEHIIRNEADYRQIGDYIASNPGKWAEDQYYTE